MKTIFGFLAVVFSVLIFAPKSNKEVRPPISLPDFERVKTYHYIPSREAIESRRKLEECERKIKANLIYLNSTNESNTQ